MVAVGRLALWHFMTTDFWAVPPGQEKDGQQQQQGLSPSGRSTGPNMSNGTRPLLRMQTHGHDTGSSSRVPRARTLCCVVFCLLWLFPPFLCFLGRSRWFSVSLYWASGSWFRTHADRVWIVTPLFLQLGKGEEGEACAATCVPMDLQSVCCLSKPSSRRETPLFHCPPSISCLMSPNVD